ncbi:MAG: hypothetical protein IKU27_07440 [Clostridia bacterium]|nr:hypothetical protein [Clostridia bacterium]
MKNILTGAFALGLPLMLTGCGAGSGNDVSAASIYGTAAVLSLFLLIGYCLIERRRDRWFLLLFSSVLVVNIGYYMLSTSHGLEGALMANRISYLGSVFLPLSMLMTILDVTGLCYKKRLPTLLLTLAAVVFLIAASPGYLDIYYKEVSFVVVDGVSMLQKVYGPLHSIYAVYLLSYFAAMVAAILQAGAKHKLESVGQAVILAIAVLANIGVWFAEQVTDFNFEFLSISYIISELFLLGLHLMVAEQQRLKSLVSHQEQELSETARTLSQTEKALSRAVAEASVSAAAKEAADDGAVSDHKIRQFADGISELTPTEKVIFDAYLQRMSGKEVMAMLNIKENTLKFHNKNLYQKLGVSSRKELLELHKQIQAEEENR